MRDHDLDQMRAFGRDGSRQGARQVARCRDALRRDPEPAGEIEEAKPRLPQIHVKVGAIGLGPETLPVHVHVVLEDAVLAVVEDDEHDGQIVVGGRPQGLDAVHGRAVARDGHHRPVGARDLDAERPRQSLSDADAPRSKVVAPLAEAERAGEIGARGDRLVHHDGVGRQRRRDVGHEPGHGDGGVVPALLGAGSLGRAV